MNKLAIAGLIVGAIFLLLMGLGQQEQMQRKSQPLANKIEAECKRLFPGNEYLYNDCYIRLGARALGDIRKEQLDDAYTRARR